MSDRVNRDLAAILAPPPSHGVQFSQGVVKQWSNDRLENEVEWRGITLTDLPMVEGISALTIQEDDVVALLGWAPENAKGVGSWWILGKLSAPGEYVGDLNVTAKLFRFVTEAGNALAFFGKQADGVPVWVLTYGGSDEQPAVQISGGSYVLINDRSGNEVFATDGETGAGLARPYLNYPLYPASTAQQSGSGSFSMWPSTDATSYEALWVGQVTVWHPEVSWSVGVAGSGGTSSVRIRVDDSVTVTTVETFSSDSAGQFTIPGWGTDVNPGDTVFFGIEGQNSGGRVWAAPRRFYGRQSLWLLLRQISLMSYPGLIQRSFELSLWTGTRPETGRLVKN